MTLWASIRDDLEVPLVGADDLPTLRQQAPDHVVSQIENDLRTADPSEAKTINMNGRSIHGIHREISFGAIYTGMTSEIGVNDRTAQVWLDPNDLLGSDGNSGSGSSGSTGDTTQPTPDPAPQPEPDPWPPSGGLSDPTPEPPDSGSDASAQSDQSSDGGLPIGLLAVAGVGAVALFMEVQDA